MRNPTDRGAARVQRSSPNQFGDSPKPWCRYTVDRHLDALDAALAGHRHMTLVGHSLGAVLAVAYAARHPAVVRRLVLLGLPYFGSQATAYRWFRHGPAELARSTAGWGGPPSLAAATGAVPRIDSSRAERRL